MRSAALFFAFLFIAPAAQALEAASVSPRRPASGDIVVVEATAMPAWGSFNLNPLRFFKWNGKPRALIGVDVEAEPGSVELYVRWANAPPVRRRVQVVAKRFAEERLTVAPKYVAPPPEALDRVWAEKQRLDALWRRVASPRRWVKPFQPPIDTPVASEFGLQRFLNGQRRSPHPGVDFRGELGLPVRASNAGMVVIAEELYYSGNTVVIDHGSGLFTIYGHLSDMTVQVNHHVDPGTIIGHVGATGRATAPHLHWGARLVQARVDPRQLLTLGDRKASDE